MASLFSTGRWHCTSGRKELPESCCDAILLRMVYHHFSDPAAKRADLARALRPGGRLAVIDITPQTSWRDLPDVPERGGHGLTPDQLVAEMESDGWTAVRRIDDWSGDADRFCVVFREGEYPEGSHTRDRVLQGAQARIKSAS